MIGLLLAQTDAPLPLILALYALFLAGMTALFSWLHRRDHLAATRALSDFARLLEGGEVLAPTHRGATLLDCRVRGASGGHALDLSFVRRGSGRSSHEALVFELQVPHPTASFEVTGVGALEGLSRLLGLRGPDALGEGSLALRDRGGAEALVQAAGVRAALRRVFEQFGVVSVTLQGTTLRVEQAVPVELERLRTTLPALVALARLCGRAPADGLRLAVRPRTGRSFVWTGGGDRACCPYCREEVDARRLSLAACDRCGTVHHEACLDEAGGCTVFGCGARTAPAREATWS